MLKFIYTETGLYLEYLPQSLESWVALRETLSQRLGQALSIAPCTASFLLSSELADLQILATAIPLTSCDADYVEVRLSGVWVSSCPEQVEGVFVATLSDRLESLIFQLWQESQVYVASPKG
jgi:hypothetical protein